MFPPQSNLSNLNSLKKPVEKTTANINTTRTPEGGPYRKKNCEVKESSKILTKYEPNHPDANEDGYVSYPVCQKKS